MEKELMKLICTGLNVDGVSVKPSHVIGSVPESIVRSTLALIIGKYEN